ncbi:MAG: glucose-6-phosphate dehydrogenase [Candidatus Doudnabacteria bacterium CG10_big_fil_rev_8_21_14_0_10_42_18]|uniref:Glucose-6-phosphate 1-dehydrogenase n=1 Tax=Candidatus Doudnabacteria bacterium CG10_big_fil_rev_8_21_14_0_10_42_18 TaxID=1974552 RepID=A0A2H0VAR7_9BACT|nr:MAG: glucose-6-phosphate dehydrogenase [Candidatus Doudnabacteria bacterium CG10_big_fil_rev_8_21_14_0_10_42_18]
MNFGAYKLSRQLSPTILTIFGSTGDLSADYLVPALLHMDKHGLLPKNFKLVCVGRRELNTRGYLNFILEKSGKIKKISAKDKKNFLKHLIYFRGDFAENPEDFKDLAKILADHEMPGGKAKAHKCYNRLFYFATNPQQFASLTRILKSSGLLTACSEHERQTRVLVEKPFGFNLKSARALNNLLLKYFKEEQIYRIDHYVGKETVQNLMVARFANSLFEPLWNNRFIDHVEISVLEKDGVGGRANFYDRTGAIEDFLQNHILQMLALIAMDEPYQLTAEMIRDEKLRVLQSLAPYDLPKLKARLVKGQYAGYQKEIGRESGTETYFALKTYINLPRWAGVPFYLRTGKRLSKKLTQISIHFREPVRCLFEGCAPNILTFKIQPDESVYLHINNKIPGFGIRLHQGSLFFGYKKTFSGELPSAYERLLLDFIEGDQRLFIRSDEIEASWKFVDSITESPQFRKLPLYQYKPGTNGPKEAEEFMHKDAKEWWTS